MTFLHHLRVAKAQTLLLMTEKTIAEIGQEVGFCDQLLLDLSSTRSPVGRRDNSAMIHEATSKCGTYEELQGAKVVTSSEFSPRSREKRNAYSIHQRSTIFGAEMIHWPV